MCVHNKGSEGSLLLGKVYKIIRPHRNDAIYNVRVIDEEGEDYLYLAEQFVSVQLPPKGRKLIGALQHLALA